jgi:hypothetical protein
VADESGSAPQGGASKRSKKAAYDDIASIANRQFVAEKYWGAIREMTKTAGTELYSKKTRSRRRPADANGQSLLLPTGLGPVAAANLP